MYAGAWEAEYGAVPQREDGTHTVAGKVWREALAGLDSTQLGEGLRMCLVRHPEWPPKLGQFRALCVGVLPLAEVRYQMRLPPSGRGPFLRVLGKYLDTFRLSRASDRAAEKLLADAYQLASEHVLRGDPIPEPQLELEHGAAATAAPYNPLPPEQRTEIIERVRDEIWPPE